LRAEVRDRADIENSQHITDAQITRYINQSGAALYAMLVEHCEDEFVEVASGAMGAPASNTTTITLSGGAYRLLSVSAVINGQDTPLERWSWQDHPRLVSAGSSGPPYFYRWIEDAVLIVPGMPAGTIATVYVVPPYVDLVADGDLYDGRSGWEEWVVLDSAIKCMSKEETDPSVLIAERTRCEERIKSQMKARDFARPDTVRDVEGFSDVEYRAGRLAPP
jgi:hypothetical protein